MARIEHEPTILKSAEYSNLPTHSDLPIFRELKEFEKIDPHSSAYLVDKAFGEIHKYATGELKQIKLPYEFLNDALIGGLNPSDIMTICAMSGGGKSFQLQKIEEAIFDKQLNPDCSDYVLVRFNWEMSVFKLMLRRLSRETKRSMRDLLKNGPRGDEAIWDRVRQDESNPNIFYEEQPLTYQKFEERCRYYLEKFKDKKRVIFSIDHIAIAKGLKKKEAIDGVIEVINDIRKEYDNSNWIILSQLNRDIELRKGSKKDQAPIKSDIYASDTIFYYSDLVVCVHMPRRLYLQEYMTFGENDYSWLNIYKTAKGRSFETEGLIFYHLLKIREMDLESGLDVRDLFVETFPKYKDTYPKRPMSTTQSSPGLYSNTAESETEEKRELFPVTPIDDEDDDDTPF